MTARSPLRPPLTLLLALLLAACGQTAAPAPTGEMPTSLAAPAPTGARASPAAEAPAAVSPAPTGAQAPTQGASSVGATPAAASPAPTGAQAGLGGAAQPAGPTAYVGHATPGPTQPDLQPPWWDVPPYQGALFSAHARTPTTITLAWDPATDNVGVVGYEIYGRVWNKAAGEQGRQDETGLTLVGATSSQTFTVTGLLPATTYLFKLHALDAAGNRAIPRTIVVLPTIDNVAPSAPTGLRLVDEWSDSNALYLRWDPATDNVQVVQYEVLLDGVPYDSVFYDPEGRIVGTLPTGTYQITVVAVDKDGTRSAPSAPLVVSGRDTTPPDPIREVRVVERTATSATIAWDPVSDNVGPVTYEIFVDQGDNVVARTAETTYTFTGLRPDSTLQIGVYARDAAGNRSFNAAGAMIFPLP
jgi:chitodextrinase